MKKKVVISLNDSNREYEEIECPKCGQKKIVSWMEQTRSADEPPTRFYKCANCGYTWREYS
ncbi:MAG: zinc ribbon domain-containing protein [Candidatus Rehaiarchaeum fermentans]